MQQQNISLFTIGIGSEINKTKLQELTKPFGDPYTCFQSNYSDLTDETTANSILDQFCNASHYTVRNDQLNLTTYHLFHAHFFTTNNYIFYFFIFLVTT